MASQQIIARRLASAKYQHHSGNIIALAWHRGALKRRVINGSAEQQ